MVQDGQTTEAGTTIGSSNVSRDNSDSGVQLKSLRTLARPEERRLTQKQTEALVRLGHFVMQCDKDVSLQCKEYLIGKNSEYCIHWYEAAMHHLAPALFAYYEDSELNSLNRYIQFTLQCTYYGQHPLEILNKYLVRKLKQQALTKKSK